MKIYARIRKNIGTNSSRVLRLKNFVPCVVYGKKKSVILIKLKKNDIMNFFHKNTSKEKILFIVLKKKKIKVKVQEIQKHPFKNMFFHIDFLRL
jgi:large subunit ribosomal protein L25